LEVDTAAKMARRCDAASCLRPLGHDDLHRRADLEALAESMTLELGL